MTRRKYWLHYMTSKQPRVQARAQVEARTALNFGLEGQVHWPAGKPPQPATRRRVQFLATTHPRSRPMTMSCCRKPARVARPWTVFVLSGGVLSTVFISDTKEVTRVRYRYSTAAGRVPHWSHSRDAKGGCPVPRRFVIGDSERSFLRASLSPNQHGGHTKPA